MTSSAPWPTNPHNPTAIRLYGVDITNPGRTNAGVPKPNIRISFINEAKRGKKDTKKIDGLRLLFSGIDEDTNQKKPVTTATIGVIYAYAFEGHCYKFDKPKVMVFFHDEPAEIAVGCGFDEFQDIDTSGSSSGRGSARLPSDVKSLWRMWLVDKLDKAIELNVDQGFFEELILEANMPGKRSPTTYSANMQVAHRGGRLTD